MIEKIKKFVEKYEVLILILLGVIVLRIPTLYEPNRYADEDIYLTLGMGVRRGLVLYRDIHDNKPPLLYWVAALASSVMWFRFILLFWNLINVVVVWKLAKTLLKKTGLVLVATFLFAIFSTIPLLEGNIANGEVFMILPASAAILLLLKDKKGLKRYLVAGWLIAIAFLFKVPIIFDVLGVLLWWIIYKGVDRRVLIVVLGFVSLILLTIGYYGMRGAGETYVKAALLQNVGYVSSWEGNSKPFYESGMFQRGVILLGTVGLILFLRKKLSGEFVLVSLWFIFALFGANLSGRPYPHYLIQIVTPGALLISSLAGTRRIQAWVIGLVLIAITGGAVFYYRYWYYTSIPYYQNFIEYSLGKKSLESYWGFWGEGVMRNKEVARIIKESTEPGDKIFVWGTEPAIYVESSRLPVGKYTVSYHVKDFGAKEEIGELLVKEKPKIVVMMEDEREDFPVLRKLLMEEYTLVKKIGSAKVYLKISKMIGLLY